MEVKKLLNEFDMAPELPLKEGWLPSHWILENKGIKAVRSKTRGIWRCSKYHYWIVAPSGPYFYDSSFGGSWYYSLVAAIYHKRSSSSAAHLRNNRFK